MAEDEERETQRLRGTRQQLLAQRTNQRIFALREDAAVSEYVCECVLRSCAVTVTLTADEYRDVRKSPTHFLIACGGWFSAIERLVHENERYVVVEKIGPEALLASRSGHDHERRDGGQD
jgi:hypothetical protein